MCFNTPDFVRSEEMRGQAHPPGETGKAGDLFPGFSACYINFMLCITPCKLNQRCPIRHR